VYKYFLLINNTCKYIHSTKYVFDTTDEYSRTKEVSTYVD